MPLALVFTSAAQGLAPGRSGFCTVARHAEMPERLATLLEGLGTPHATPGTATLTLRRVEAGGRTWRVLSRFTAGGLDYTRRDNRLAHHLAFAEDELTTLPPPADVARRWPGWLSEWSGPPRWLEPIRLQLAPAQPLVPCAGWRRMTGTGAKAAWLVSGEAGATACLVNAGDSAVLLGLLAESAALIGRAAWDTAFTTDAAVTSAEGFTWCGGEVGGRRCIDLAASASQPAPEGEKARLAAFGVATRAVGPPPAPPAMTGEDSGASRQAWIIVGVLAAAVLVLLAILLPRRAEPPTAPTPPPQAAHVPSADEMAAAASILKASAAISELESVIGRGDLVAAARQWEEIARLSPGFAAMHSDRFLPRLRSGIAASAADSLDRRLSAPGAAEDTRALAQLRAEADDAVRAAADIGAPRDAQWARLGEMSRRIRMLSELDIRDTWVAPGQWVTGSAGPAVPSTADFDLGRESGEHVARFLREGLTGGAGTSTPVTIRLCALNSLAQRDGESRMLRARLEPGAQSLWVSEESGARRPGVTLSVGARANTVSVNFPGPPPADFTRTNRGLELTNPAGKRLCLALVVRPDAFTALQPGLGGLVADAGTLATAPAAWIEPVFLRTRMAGGRIGLYPAGHEFPERVASLSCSRNVVDTDLLRQAAGNGTVPRSAVAERRRRLDAGDPVGAGAPWTIRFVDARGQALLDVAEFR